MREEFQTNTKPANSVRGQILEQLVVNDETTRGNDHITYDQEVQHGSLPLSPSFGLLSSSIYNERNSTKSRRKDLHVDTETLHTLPAIEYDGMASIGDDYHKEFSKLVPVADIAETQLESGHNVIADRIDSFDKFHGIQKTVKVDKWEPRTIVNTLDQDAGGSSSTTVKQVVKGDDVWPVSDYKTLDLSREQIGIDKHLQTNRRADSFNELKTVNLFGSESCETETTVQKVANGYVMPAKAVSTLAQSLQELNDKTSVYMRTRLVNGWPTLVSYEEEPTTGKGVTVTRTVHDVKPTYPVDGVARTANSIQHTGCDRWTKIQRTIDPSILTTSFNEYHPVEFDFPAYLNPTNPFLTVNGNQRFDNPQVSSNYRLKVNCRFLITYHSTAPTLQEVFQFKTVNLNLAVTTTGYASVNISLPKIITDSFESVVWFLLDPNNAAGGTTNVTLNYPASSPTATEYLQAMEDETEVMIIQDSSKWKYNLWRQVRVYMVIPDLRAFTPDN